MMKKILGFAMLLAASAMLTLPVFSISKAESERLLQLAEDNSGFYDTDFSGNYTVVQDKPGEGQSIIEAV